MFERFGPVVTGKRVEFRLFFPNGALFSNGDGPKVKEIRVRGDFQSKIGGVDWDFATAPLMTKNDFKCIDVGLDFAEDPNGVSIGTLFTLSLDTDLPDGYYQYKYYPTFEDNTQRWCSDPCTKLTGSSEFENSAFVVGGNTVAVSPITKRTPLRDLVTYELMVDDLTAQFRGNRAPIDAVGDKLDYVLGLGVNAIEFMPLMGVPTQIPPCADDYDWGYIPNWHFAVENRYVEDGGAPLDRLFKLKQLINTLHARNTQVIFDGVFNHVAPQVTGPNKGFPYHWLYMNPSDSPFTGGFAQVFGDLEDLDYNNRCTELYIFDVCKYWLDVFQFDGIRFDFTAGFLVRDPNLGIAKLVSDLKTYLSQTGRSQVALILEDINGYQAIDDTNFVCATGNWFDEWLHKNSQYMNGNVDGEALRIFNANFQYGVGKSPVTYIDNHDHSTATQRAGGRASRWFKTQPPAIALLTCPGAPLIRNGQEFGEEYFLPDDDRLLPCEQKRVNRRPLRWNTSSVDEIGQRLYSMYQALIQIRNTYASLRSPNFFPADSQNHDGYGVFPGQNVVIYHRYGQGQDGSLERFIIVVNYSDFDQTVDVPFSDNGTWTDLLNGVSFSISDFHLPGHRVPSNWGRIFFRRN